MLITGLTKIRKKTGHTKKVKKNKTGLKKNRAYKKIKTKTGLTKK